MGRKNKKKKNRKAAVIVKKKPSIAPQDSALHFLLEEEVLAPIWKLRYQWLDVYTYFAKELIYNKDVSKDEMAVLRNVREFTSQYLQLDPRLGLTEDLDSQKAEVSENLENESMWEYWEDLKSVFMQALKHAGLMNSELDHLIKLLTAKDKELNCEGFLLAHVPNLKNLAKRHSNRIMKNIHLLKVPDFFQPIPITESETGPSSLGQDTDRNENQVHIFELVKDEIEKLVTLFGINQLGLQLEFFVFYQYIASNDLECCWTVDCAKYLQHLGEKLSNFYDSQLIDLLNEIEIFMDNFANTVPVTSVQVRMKNLKSDFGTIRDQILFDKNMLMMTQQFSFFEDFDLTSSVPNFEEDLGSPLATYTCFEQITTPGDWSIPWINLLLECRLEAYSKEVQNLRNLKLAAAMIARDLDVQQTSTKQLLAKTISMIETSDIEDADKQSLAIHFEEFQSSYSNYTTQYVEEFKGNLLVAEEQRRLQKMAKKIGMINDYAIIQGEIVSNSEWDEFMLADVREQLEIDMTEDGQQVEEYISKYLSCITHVANFCCNTWPSYVRRCQDFLNNECVSKQYYNTETISVIQNLAKYVNIWQNAIQGHNGLAKITDPGQIITVSAKSLEWINENGPDEPYIWNYQKRANFISEIGELHDLMKKASNILSHGVAVAVETLRECSDFKFSELNIAHLSALDNKMFELFLWNYHMLSNLPEDDLDLVALNTAMRSCVVHVDNESFEKHYSALSLLMQFWENSIGSMENKPPTEIVSFLITNLVECKRFKKRGAQELIYSILESLGTRKDNSFRVDQKIFKKTIGIFIKDILWLSVETRNLDKYRTLSENFERIMSRNVITVEVVKSLSIPKQEERPSSHHEDSNRPISFRKLSRTKHRRRIN